MKILVASENPNKIKGAKMAFEKWFGKECETTGMKAESGVKDTPVGLEETIEGLENRLSAISENPGYDYYVALEGAVVNDFLVTVAMVSGKSGKWLGHSPGFKIPEKVIEGLKKGRKLSDFAESLTGVSGIKRKHGLMGHATKGILSREDSNYLAVLMALATKNIC